MDNDLSQIAKALGKKGGETTRDRLGNEHFVKLAYKSAKVRQARSPRLRVSFKD